MTLTVSSADSATSVDGTTERPVPPIGGDPRTLSDDAIVAELDALSAWQRTHRPSLVDLFPVRERRTVLDEVQRERKRARRQAERDAEAKAAADATWERITLESIVLPNGERAKQVWCEGRLYGQVTKGFGSKRWSFTAQGRPSLSDWCGTQKGAAIELVQRTDSVEARESKDARDAAEAAAHFKAKQEADEAARKAWTREMEELRCRAADIMDDLASLSYRFGCATAREAIVILERLEKGDLSDVAGRMAQVAYLAEETGDWLSLRRNDICARAVGQSLTRAEDALCSSGSFWSSNARAAALKAWHWARVYGYGPTEPNTGRAQVLTARELRSSFWLIPAPLANEEDALAAWRDLRDQLEPLCRSDWPGDSGEALQAFRDTAQRLLNLSPAGEGSTRKQAFRARWTERLLKKATAQ